MLRIVTSWRRRDDVSTDDDGFGEKRMLKTGQNCWQIATATKSTVIVDASDYFRAAREAMLKARRQILLISWDFDARIRFKDMDAKDDGPEQVGAFISWLTRRTPGLQVYILRWDTGAIKTLLQFQTLFRIAKWARDDQVHLKLDGNHPLGGSHHQKVLVIDDAVAFCGGIDVTAERWDTREHADEEPRRVGPNDKAYKPWHDATTVLEGPVAKVLGDLCRERWKATGVDLEPPVRWPSDHWPESVKPDFTDVEVGIARTLPEMDVQQACYEIEELYVDLIARAKRWIYAETQYFASRKIAEAIGRRLAEPDGPEIVIVHPLTAEGWLQPIAMDSARARLAEALREQDPRHRLRLYHPFTTDGEPIYVHAKIMVIDDDVLRVGSSNFNNRSMRLDTECDVVIDVERPANRAAGPVIAGIRNALLAEHLGTDCRTIEGALTETGSVIETVERLRGAGRSLRPYEAQDIDSVRAWLADNKVLDPEGPGEMFESLSQRKQLVPGAFRNERGGISPLAVGTLVVARATAVAAGAFFRRRRKGDGSP